MKFNDCVFFIFVLVVEEVEADKTEEENVETFLNNENGQFIFIQLLFLLDFICKIFLFLDERDDGDDEEDEEEADDEPQYHETEFNYDEFLRR